MQRVAVLGCGLVGATIARDLAADGGFEVTASDLDADRLAGLDGIERLTPERVDLGSAASVEAFAAPFDVVVGALPSRFGFQTLGAIIAAGKPYCDISFMPEDALALDAEAAAAGVCAVVDCGVAPGLANLAIGRSQAEFERTEAATIYVGGLPRARRLPWQYKAPFAPADVLEEYTRPARIKRAGEQVVLEALSEPEPIEVETVGTLEAVVTDGLRSLLTTIDAPDLTEKTLRYPGHADLVRALRDSGFLSPEPIQVGQVEVSPLALSSALLFEQWALAPGEPEFTYLEVVVEGRRAGRRERHTYSLFDETDPATGTSSMARTTGFPAAIVARLLATGDLATPGVLPPERLAPLPEVYRAILDGLAERGVDLRRRVETA